MNKTVKPRNPLLTRLENCLVPWRVWAIPFWRSPKNLRWTQIVAHPNATELVGAHFQKDEVAFKEFVNAQKHLVMRFLSTNPEGQDNTYLPTNSSILQWQGKTGLKRDCNLFSRLFISHQAQECDLLESFKYENHSGPFDFSAFF